jgi:lysophospholipase L1-like esterase
MTLAIPFVECHAGWVVIALCLVLAGCAPRSSPERVQTQPPPPIRYLALGDSYTIGESVGESERWPVQLAAALREQGLPVAEPLIIARTGWTTAELQAGIQGADPSGPFELVSLLIGVNNQYRGLDLEQYRVEFCTLLRQAIDLAGADPGRVIVLSIPDWGVMPFAAGRDGTQIAAEIDRFNQVNRDETQQAGARYVDITAISREAATDRALIAADGLHPSAEMYAAWVQLALPEALAALGGSVP